MGPPVLRAGAFSLVRADIKTNTGNYRGDYMALPPQPPTACLYTVDAVRRDVGTVVANAASHHHAAGRPSARFSGHE